MAISIQNATTSAPRWHAAITSVAVLVLALQARGAQDVGVDAQLQGNVLAISTHATIRASLPTIWQTLTDYDHLAEFIPGMRMSRVLQRHGATVIVEQVGEAKFLIFHYPIDVVVQSDEHYPATIAVHVLSGNL